MNKDLDQICKLFYSSFSIPVFCFQENDFSNYPKTSFKYENGFSFFDRSDNRKTLIHSDKDSLFWAKIQNGDNTLIIGPVSMTFFSDRIIHSLMARFFIRNEDKDEFKAILDLIPRMSLYQFSSAVQILYQLLNDHFIPIEEIELTENLKRHDEKNETKLKELVMPVFYQAQDNGLELYDISYEAEQEMIRNIESGNIEALKKSFSASDAKKFGSLADTTIRSTKNMFIVVIAIASRTAIRNGLSVQVAYKLSDLYIQEIEQTSSFSGLTALVRNAVIDYSQRIQALKVPKGTSPLVFEGMKFIEQSVSQPITVVDVAEHVGKSVSYYSALFKKETGINIISYISSVKIEEAKRLLIYTDKSLIDISNFLWFSSQSHFQRVFKKTVGITPLSYRNRNKGIASTDTLR